MDGMNFEGNVGDLVRDELHHSAESHNSFEGQICLEEMQEEGEGLNEDLDMVEVGEGLQEHLDEVEIAEGTDTEPRSKLFTGVRWLVVKLDKQEVDNWLLQNNRNCGEIVTGSCEQLQSDFASGPSGNITNSKRQGVPEQSEHLPSLTQNSNVDIPSLVTEDSGQGSDFASGPSGNITNSKRQGVPEQSEHLPSLTQNSNVDIPSLVTEDSGQGSDFASGPSGNITNSKRQGVPEQSEHLPSLTQNSNVDIPSLVSEDSGQGMACDPSSSFEIEKMLGHISSMEFTTGNSTELMEKKKVATPLYMGCKKLVAGVENGNFQLSQRGNFCHLCRCVVEVEDIYHHAVFSHLGEKAVCCGYCDFSTTWNFAKVKGHMEAEHKGQPMKILDKRDAFVEKVEKLVYHCFPTGMAKKSSKEEFSFVNSRKRKAMEDELVSVAGMPELEAISDVETTKSEEAFTQPISALDAVSAVMDPKTISLPTGPMFPDKVGRHGSKTGFSKVVRNEQSVPSFVNGELMEHSTKNEILSKKNSLRPCKWCQICQRLVVVHFERHVLVNHLRKPAWCCPYCSYFNTGVKRGLHNHIQSWHPDRPLVYVDRRSEYKEEVAELMDLAFPTPVPVRIAYMHPDVNNVEENKVDERKWCEICQQLVDGQLKYHVVAHHSEKPVWFCPYCKYSTPNDKQRVDEHILTNHPSGPMSHNDKVHPDVKNVNERKWCEICQQLVDTGLKQHVLTHHLKKQIWFCPYCHYSSTTNKQSVDDHIGVNHPDLPVFCVDKRAAYEKELMVKAFPNDIVYSSALEKPVVDSNICQICHSVVAAKFERHILVHHLKKPVWFCPYCEYSSASRKSNVEHHIRGKHPDKTVLCIDKKSDHEEKIGHLMALAFPNHPYSGSVLFQWKNKEKEYGYQEPGKIAAENNGESKVVVQEGLYDRFAPKASASPNVCSALTVEETNMRMNKDKEGLHVHVMFGRSGAGSEICQICQCLVISQFERHVLTHHLKKSVFWCPHCQYRTGAKRTLDNHIRAQHPGKTVYCIDKRADYREEITELMHRAFPTRAYVGSARRKTATEYRYDQQAPGITPQNKDDESEVIQKVEIDEGSSNLDDSSATRVEVTNRKKTDEIVVQNDYEVAKASSGLGVGPDIRVEALKFNHILRLHPGKTVTCIDKRSDYEKEIRELTALAFPKYTPVAFPCMQEKGKPPEPQVDHEVPGGSGVEEKETSDIISMINSLHIS